jgi:hypothetical protein
MDETARSGLEVNEPTKILLKFSEVIDWLVMYGFSHETARRMILKGEIKKHDIPIGKMNYYHKREVKVFLKKCNLL